MVSLVVNMTDTRWLVQRGRTWYALQAVPRDLRQRMGKLRLLKSLGTRDLRVAIAKRHAALAEFQRAFDAARAADVPATLTTAALAWRDVPAVRTRRLQHVSCQ